MKKMREMWHKNLHKIIALAGFVLLFVGYLYWIYTTPGNGIDYYIVALVSCVLSFCIFWFFAYKMVDFFKKSYRYETPVRHRVKLKTTLFLVFAGVLAISAVMAVTHLMLKHLNLDSSLSFWLCTDSAHYMDIAKEWYLSEGTIHRLVQLVFFPGYPILVRLLNYIIDNFLVSGLLISWIALIASAIVLYKLILLDNNEKTALRAVKYLFICPAIFFYVAPMSDSLFLLLCLLCFYFVRTDRLWLGCIIGACASFTRSLGITLIVPVLFEVIHKLVNDENASVKKFFSKLLPIPVISIGLIAYFCINFEVSGNPFQFMIYQKEHWGQSFGFYFGCAAKYYSLIKKCIITPYPDALWGKVIPNLISLFLPLVLMLITGRKMRCSYTAWFITYYMFSMGAVGLLSGPRYMMSCFPLFISHAILTENKKTDTIFTVGSIILLLAYMFAFVQRWSVW